MEQNKKIYQLKVSDYYATLIRIMSFVTPFSGMRQRMKDVYVELLKKNEAYSKYPERERSKLIFDRDTWSDIALKLGVSDDVVKNVISELRAQNFIIKSPNGYEIINPSYILPRVDTIGFNIIESNGN